MWLRSISIRVVKPITCDVVHACAQKSVRRNLSFTPIPFPFPFPFLIPIHDAANVGWISSSSWRYHVGLLRSGQHARSTRRNVFRNSYLKFITLIVKPILIAVSTKTNRTDCADIWSGVYTPARSRFQLHRTSFSDSFSNKTLVCRVSGFNAWDWTMALMRGLRSFFVMGTNYAYKCIPSQVIVARALFTVQPLSKNKE